MNKINEGNHGEKLYRVLLGTGTIYLEEFYVYAYNETEAADLVADYCEEHEFCGLYGDFYDLADLCENGETVDEYAEANGLICCGNHGIYIELARIEEVSI